MERLDGNTHRIQRYVKSSGGETFGTNDASRRSGVQMKQAHRILGNMQCVQVDRRGRWRGGNRYKFIGGGCSACRYSRSKSDGCVIELNLP